MPQFNPFHAIRPRKDLAADISAKSTDFKKKSDLKTHVQENKYSWHRLSKYHIVHKDKANPESFISEASSYLEEMFNEGALIKENEAAYYIYQQFNPQVNQTFIGVVGLCAIDDYRNNKVKIHEETNRSKELKVGALLNEVGVLGEAVLISGGNNLKSSDLANMIKGKSPEYSFQSPDEKLHQIWVISKEDDIEIIQKKMTSEDCFYIADGHHRSKTVSNYYLEQGRSNGHLMCLWVSEADLLIRPFYRYYKFPHHKNSTDLEKFLNQYFKKQSTQKEVVFPSKPYHFGLFIDKQWVSYILKSEYQKDYENIPDVNILEEIVVKNFFEIQDSGLSNDVKFQPPNIKFKKVNKPIIDKQYDVIFTTYPGTFDLVKQIAENGLKMPPKSTFIEPKFRTGLIIQEL